MSAELLEDLRATTRRALSAGGGDVVDELDLAGLLVESERGGLGLGEREMALVSTELGRALSPSSFLPTAVLAATLLTHAEGDTAAELFDRSGRRPNPTVPWRSPARRSRGVHRRRRMAPQRKRLGDIDAVAAGHDHDGRRRRGRRGVVRGGRRRRRGHTGRRTRSRPRADPGWLDAGAGAAGVRKPHGRNGDRRGLPTRAVGGGRRAAGCGTRGFGRSRRICQDAQPIRSAHRVVPGDQTSLRRGAARCRAGGRRHRSGGADGSVRRCRAGVRRGHPRSDFGCRVVYPHPRRDRFHLGAPAHRYLRRARVNATLLGPATVHRDAIAASAGLSADGGSVE